MLKEILNLNNPFGEDFGNWKRAIIENNGKDYRATFKRVDKKSEFGINGGRIIKLSIIDFNKKELCSYDRGWDLKPTNKETKAVLEELLDNEN